MLLAACSSNAPTETAEEQPEPEPTPTPDPTCPLTGAEPGKVDLTRPAVAVKVENSPQARPQAGLEEADIVFEEVVEGGITRFMAIYHCGNTDKVGPVRSARFDDAKIAKPFTRLLAFSGSNDIVDEELKDQGIVLVDEISSGPALYRIPPGVLDVHNLFGNVGDLRNLPAAEEVEPPSFALTFGDVQPEAKDAKKVKLNFTNSITIEYKWADGAWQRFEDGEPFLAASGGQIAVPNVLVQEVEVNNSESIFDIAGNPSPDIKMEGSGRAWLFRDGKVIEGTWTAAKPKKDQPPLFIATSGEPMVFAEGTTWFELVPSDKGNVKGKIKFK